MLMQNELVGPGRRLVALAVDLLVLKLIDIPLSRVLQATTLSPAAVLVLEFMIMLMYSVFFLNRRGQTPGKMLTNTRVISVDGGTVTQMQALLRAAVKWTPIFGFLVALTALNPLPAAPRKTPVGPQALLAHLSSANPARFRLMATVGYAGVAVAMLLMYFARRHPDRQALHDRIAGTLVIRMP